MASKSADNAGESSKTAAERVPASSQNEGTAPSSDFTSFTTLGVEPPVVEDDPAEAPEPPLAESKPESKGAESKSPTFWKRVSGGWTPKK